MAGEESRAAALTFASRVVAGSESVEGDATAALVHGLLYVGDQVGALTGLRLPYTDLTLGDLLAGNGKPSDRDEQTGEWLAALPSVIREWVLSFPDDLIGHPLLAGAIESASNASSVIVPSSEGKAHIIGNIRAFQAKLREVPDGRAGD